MAYALHTLKVVSGAVLTLPMYLAADSHIQFDGLVLFGGLFLLGLFCMVHGLFTGIAAAVRAGTTPAAETRSDD
ncbi:hypothetical protein ELS19_08260 [Halogeometricum borinquense]|uniref:Uncharacterized protein n=1 Tax=Halogeometricum borinquense TaxID=60847 RepID=A0A482TKY4_9EURY|nr:hypothetical protein [Halogeometricum borinquense]RYJ13961.1 hypothetical protein ELS19_08260 [Halogeometricum borinquense]